MKKIKEVVFEWFARLGCLLIVIAMFLFNLIKVIAGFIIFSFLLVFILAPEFLIIALTMKMYEEPKLFEKTSNWTDRIFFGWTDF